MTDMNKQEQAVYAQKLALVTPAFLLDFSQRAGCDYYYLVEEQGTGGFDNALRQTCRRFHLEHELMDYLESSDCPWYMYDEIEMGIVEKMIAQGLVEPTQEQQDQLERNWIRL